MREDVLRGGAGADDLRGGDGSDGYVFADGWGKDTITDAENAEGKLSFVNYEPAQNDVIVDLRYGPGPEAKDASGTNTINWDGKVIYAVWGGDGDDEITGDDEHNLLSGLGGADTIYGGADYDTIHVDDGSLSDTAHCGPGSDAVYFDREPVSGASDTIASDC
jgi:Ca2+-binding RTX toxin-like protein